MDDLEDIWTTEALVVSNLLERVGAETRVVGGPVRDTLLGVRPKDLDLCTEATPEAMLRAADAAGVRTFPTLGEVRADPRLWSVGGLRHGTVSFVVDGEVVEATTLRRDVETDGRHATVEFVSDFTEDAARRDFTFNAMSVDRGGHLHDHFGGRDDLASRIVRFVGDPDERIREDRLRILRYFRFRGRYGEPDATASLHAHRAHRESMRAIAAGVPGLERISGERVWQEMARILTGASVAATLGDMTRSGVAEALGLRVSAAGIGSAALSAASGASAPVTLGLLMPEGAVDLAGRWRMSGADAALQEFCATRSATAHLPFSAFVDLALEPRTRRDHVCALLLGFGRHGDAVALSRPLPEFPVRGADLVAAGAKPGPGIGRTLAEMRETWRASGYAASAEDLLDGVFGASVPRP